MSFLKALSGQNLGPPPIWLMRQAGRYLPTYRALKQQRSLYDMFHDPQTIVTVTKLPFETLDLDAAILFSDILTVLDGLGVPYTFQEQVGPVIEFQDFSLKKHAYQHIQEGIDLLKDQLSVPLIGFAGAPFTIASYLVEGRTTKNFLKAKRFLFEQPKKFEDLLQQVTEETCRYLDVQIQAGVDAIQIFDSWAHHVAYAEFTRFVLPYLDRVVQHVKARHCPVIIFSKATSLFAEELAALEPSAISADWNADLAEVRQRIPPHIALQGNLDPAVLYGSKETIQQATDRILRAMAGNPGYIFNLGHGVLPDTPYENVKYLVDYVKHHTILPVSA